jgi:hypothetical protein
MVSRANKIFCYIRELLAYKRNIFVKGRPIQILKYEDLEYVHSMEGRCLSYRSKGKMSSVRVRNVKYGTESLIFLGNPRVVLKY